MLSLLFMSLPVYDVCADDLLRVSMNVLAIMPDIKAILILFLHFLP